MTYTHTIKLSRTPNIIDVQHDPCTSYWLRSQLDEKLRNRLNAAIDRDPVDALHDAELLVAVLAERLKTIQRRGASC